jgi:late competence protein required for DNA uptake (superfamily II DNA/RNA helicase)
MNQCFKCKEEFSLPQLKRFSSGRSYCQICVLASFYSCEICGEKFLLGEYAENYENAKQLAWKGKLDHSHLYHK